MTPDQLRQHRERIFPIILSFISAFVDAICYIGLFRTFTAFITGTLIILAADVVQEDSGFITKIIVAVSFIVCLLLWVLIIQRFLDHRLIRPALFLVEAALLAVFMVGGVYLAPLPAADSPETIFLAVVAVIAMSLQNALMAVVLSAHVPTTVMTGNLTRFAVSTIAIFGLSRKDERANLSGLFETRSQLKHYLYVLSAFVIGALAGAAGFFIVGFWALACPVIALVGLSLYRS